ncbi:MAG: hypothetical protein CMJ46_12490 [Planctomyces sp.]|nr:hypothetical protein [Planctomyces sp.]
MFRPLTLLCVAILALSTASDSAGAERVDYLKQVKPILSTKCYACHGALKQESDLRLETRELMLKGGYSGEAFIARDAEHSLLIERIVADPEERMPPAEEGSALTAEEIAILRNWIDQGAESPQEEIPADPSEHWAFRPLERPALPVANDEPAIRNPIDHFLAAEHQQLGLTPTEEAAPVVQLRRLYFDLIGVPPPVEEVLAVEQSPTSDWYEKKVDQLLNDPRYGERWGRHWMDVWRYSEWSGLNGQLRYSQKHIWHWRDWIIESLNDDIRYDEMVRQMLAADELYPDDLDKLRATGYLARNWTLFNRTEWMDNVVEHVSKGFLGLTTNCAKCHDHKYDPISQHDYYALRAVFEPYHVRLDMVPGETDLVKDAIPRAFDGLLQEPTYLFIRGDERNPDKSAVIEPNVPETLRFSEVTVEPVDLPHSSWQPARRAWVFESHLNKARERVVKAEAREKSLSEKTDSHPGDVSVAAAELTLAERELSGLEHRIKAMQSAWEAGTREAAILKNAPDRELARLAIQAERDIEVARAQKAVAEAERKLSSAAEADSKKLKEQLDTARNALQKLQKAQEKPISEDDRYTWIAGAEWTPTRFTISTTDDPEVAFVPQSSGRRTMLAEWIVDPRNPLTARVAVNHIWARHMGAPLHSSMFDFGLKTPPPENRELLDWLAAELIESGWKMKHLHRLMVMSAAYRRSSATAGGDQNTDLDPENRYWWRRQPMPLESEVVRDAILAHAGTLDETMGGSPVEGDQQADSHRRSLYFFHSADTVNLFLGNFNSPDVTGCYRRESSIQPQQALALNNSKLVLKATPSIASQISAGDEDDATFIRKAFLVLLGIEPGDEEVSASESALKSWQTEAGSSPIEARSFFIWSLLNHNDFVTLR